MPLLTGQIVNNRYRIIQLLGKGGFGTVYRAWDLNLNRSCAVKENLDTSPAAQAQFEHEALLLANLHHPNLARVSDYFSIQGRGQYFVMDFIEGEDLEQQLEQRGTSFAEKQALGWIQQVREALTYLHSQPSPIIHRDIKPANIKITPQGKAVLVDFGIAKTYDPHQKTTQGARAVSPGYSPPEQYSRGATDARSDVYALGATLYTLLTANKPVESVLRHMGAPLVPPSSYNKSISPHIEAAILRAMEIIPDQRYQTMAEFKADLESQPALQTGQVILSPNTGALPQPAVKRQLRLDLFVWVALAAAIIGLFIFGSTGLAILAAQAATPTALAEVYTAPETVVLQPSPDPVTATSTLLPPKESSPTPAPNLAAPTATQTSAPTATAARFGGLGERIVYAAVIGGNWEIMLMNADGSGQENLTNHPSNDWQPAWSPDGSRLAFASRREGNYDICVMNADGSGLVNLTNSPADDQVPAWSPDGEWITFQSNRSGNRDIFAMRTDGSDLTNLTNQRGNNESAAWSPDGNWIAFQTDRNRDQLWDIYVMRPNGSQQTPLTLSEKGGLTPAWSPDSNRIAFISFRDGNAEIYVLTLSEAFAEPDKTPPIRLTRHGAVDWQPAWSPDGKRIVFSSKRSGDYEIYTMNPDGTDVQRLTTRTGHDQFPVWQP